jgi:ketose-bisphosphate aldolases
MPLVTMKELLAEADKSDYGVGAFNIINMETVIGAVKAAEQLEAPIIMQVAEARLKYSPLRLIGPMMVRAARNSRVPIAVHFDHGLTEEAIGEALDIGFTSVMYDGSKLPLEENVAKTRRIIQTAKQYGATVEAEIGRVGGSEDGTEDLEMLATSVHAAQVFWEKTLVDALAVAIGNAHGVYKSAPQLMFDRLQDIDRVVGAPLVLHGGSGITVEDFRTCIKYGIKKINVATATFNNVVKEVGKLYGDAPQPDYYSLIQCSIDATFDNVSRHIIAFMSAHKV